MMPVTEVTEMEPATLSRSAQPREEKTQDLALMDMESAAHVKKCLHNHCTVYICNKGLIRRAIISLDFKKGMNCSILILRKIKPLV